MMIAHIIVLEYPCSMGTKDEKGKDVIRGSAKTCANQFLYNRIIF